MTRSIWILLLLLLHALALLLLGNSQYTLAQDVPNIVLILSDDAGYSDFGFMDLITGGQTEFITPNLDALAQQSVVLSNGYVTSPTCSASRAGLLTGRYQSRFGVGNNFANTNSQTDGLPTDQMVLPERLKELGYRTAAIGKWHLGLESAKQPLNRGFDEFYGFWEGQHPYFLSGSHSIRRGAVPIDWADEPSFNNVAPDPTRGRHLTDAFGDEASRFIANNARQNTPFFLYASFNAPHSPYDAAKAQDLRQFDGTSLEGTRKNVAALTFGMDRAIGQIMSRLDDPNGDGDQSDSVADKTIVIFINDNGGRMPIEGIQNHDNFPLKDYKGSTYEGGTRVPFLIKLPGIKPGTLDTSVITTDLFPTLINAAGGQMSTPTDGVDLAPFLSGTQTGQIHNKLFWRGGGGNVFWAVQKGNWKLAKGRTNSKVALYQLTPDGTGEENDLSAVNADKFQELLEDFVEWEVTLAKPSQSDAIFAPANRFDQFRFRNDVDTSMNWDAADAWVNHQDDSQIVTMYRWDAYANAVLVFQPREDASYTAINNIVRGPGTIGNNTQVSGLMEFMLNELRLEGDKTQNIDQSGTIVGNPLLFTKNRQGLSPQIALHSNQLAEGAFTYNVDVDLVLYDDLKFTGGGNVNYNFGGIIRDFAEPRSVTKNGVSSITLSGHSTFAGDVNVNNGQIRIGGSDAALDGLNSLRIGPQGNFTLDSGLVRTELLEIAANGKFDFVGGILQTEHVLGDLVVNGGEFRPGTSTAEVAIVGDFDQRSGMLHIEIGGLLPGSGYDHLLIDGRASLAGVFRASLVDIDGGLFVPELGDSFEIISADSGVIGDFDAIVLPPLDLELAWKTVRTPGSFILQVVDALPGDFNADGRVNSDDLDHWISAFIFGPVAGANSDEDIGGGEFLAWQRDYGKILPGLSADFDLDKDVDQKDLDLWNAAFAVSILGDSDRDGDTDGDDFLAWQRGFGNSLSKLTADFDLDNDVDGADLILWSSAFGPNSAGDADEDGDSDGGDFIIWQREFSQTMVGIGTPAGLIVPEPACLTVASIATLLLIAFHNVRHCGYRNLKCSC